MKCINTRNNWAESHFGACQFVPKFNFQASRILSFSCICRHSSTAEFSLSKHMQFSILLNRTNRPNGTLRRRLVDINKQRVIISLLAVVQPRSTTNRFIFYEPEDANSYSMRASLFSLHNRVAVHS